MDVHANSVSFLAENSETGFAHLFNQNILEKRLVLSRTGIMFSSNNSRTGS